MASIKHTRVQQTLKVPLSQIELDPSSRTDPRITNTYAALLRGELKTALTRVSCSSIISGFYIRPHDCHLRYKASLRVRWPLG